MSRPITTMKRIETKASKLTRTNVKFLISSCSTQTTALAKRQEDHHRRYYSPLFTCKDSQNPLKQPITFWC